MKNSKYSFLAFLALAASPSSWACDCKPSGPVIEEIPQYEVILKGVITARHPQFHEVKVEEAFKGVKKGEVLKINYNRNNMCDLDLEPKTQYVLFLNKTVIDGDARNTPGTWHASLCTPGGVIKNAGKTLKDLRMIFRKKNSQGPE